jgi:hypothetical protein
VFFFFGPFEFLFPFLIFYFVFRVLARSRQDDAYHRRNLEDTTGSMNRSTRASIYRLADRQQGKLTVSDVVIETGIAVEEAETMLQSMVDNQHVRMEVRDDGIVYYEFPEIQDKYRQL